MAKKETKQSIVETLKGLLVNATKDAKEVIDYVVKSYEGNPRNATLEELKETLSIVKEMIVVQPSLVPMENSLKAKAVTDKKIVVTEETDKKKVLPIKKKHTKEEEEKALKELEDSINGDDAEDKEEDTVEKEIAVDKTKKTLPLKKKEDKEVKSKEEAKPKENKTTNKEKAKDKEPVIKSMEMAASFPEELTSLVGKLKVRPDIKTIKELHDAIEEEVQLVVCVYWNKRQLRQFNYDQTGICAKYPREFPDDLDVVDIMYASENGLVVYGVSLYTEVAVTFTPQQFETDEETGIRYQNGAEYQIYEIVE